MKQFYFRFVSKLLIIPFVLISVQLAEAQSFLKAQDKKIVDGSGNEVHLKGIGLGGWLVQEGYMLHTSGFANSPTEIRNKIEGLVGKDNADKFYDAYIANYVNRKDIEAIAKWGFNSVRLPFHYNLFTPKDQPYVYIDKGFTIVDSLLSWCRDNHIYLILDMHCAPGSQNSDNIGDYDPSSPSLWQDTLNQGRTVDLWKKLAERYANDPWIGGYDLLNETHWNLGSDNKPLRDLFIRITNAVREVDKNHIIFIEGNTYATDFNGLTPPWDDNMVYSFHKYWNDNSQSSIQSYLTLRNDNNVPLWLGESGENSNSWFTDCIKLMDANDIGWSWWPHKKIESIAVPLSAKLTPQYQALLNYWSGSGARPTAAAAFSALMGEADQLHFDKCTFRPDVIDALIRQPSSQTSVQFTQNVIPGLIFGSTYDMGPRGVAYQDADYQQVNGSSQSAWNRGGGYRNDGVDLESCTDFPTNGYDIGYISSAEWVTYTVNVEKAGAYDLNIRIAGGQLGGQILVRFDNQPLTGYIDVPYTGGWQSWQTISVTGLTLPAGKHTVRVDFAFGGFNFNYLEFTPSTVDVKKDDNLPDTYMLYQNFPNPFNPSTEIKYSIPQRSYVDIKIYDITGKAVRELVGKEQDAGYYTLNVNAGGLSSGVYLCVLKAGNYTDMKKLILMK